MALKKQFNAITSGEPQWLAANGRPWVRAMHRDAHAQPCAYLANAWERFFADIKVSKPAHVPPFKKKGRCRDSCSMANDTFKLDGTTIRLPKIGNVLITETVRRSGTIMGTTVSRTTDRWDVAIRGDVSEAQGSRNRTAHGTVGVDLGITSAAPLSGGEAIQAPQPHTSVVRRFRIRSRRLSHRVDTAKRHAGVLPRQELPKGTRRTLSHGRTSSATLARRHAHRATIRSDGLSVSTSALPRRPSGSGRGWVRQGDRRTTPSPAPSEK